MLFFPHCRAQQKHFSIYLLADALQVTQVHLQSANFSGEEAAEKTPGRGEEAPSQKCKSLWTLPQGYWLVTRALSSLYGWGQVPSRG